MEYIVFKKHSKKTNKDYFELCKVENGKFINLGFVHIKDKTQTPTSPVGYNVDTSNKGF